MSSITEKKLILVIGATGAQGRYIIKDLLAPNEDGTPSQYAIRALTREPEHWRAKELAELGAEIYHGSFYDRKEMAKFFDGCYGAFVNLDTYTVGEAREIWSAIKLYEAAKRTKTMRHWVWSSLDYGLKLANYDQQYKAEHYDAKGAVTDWLKAQVSDPTGDGLTWTSLVTSVYMEMLDQPLLGPLNVREDGTSVFAHVFADGHVPMIALDDVAWWTRYVFEHRAETSGKELFVASDWVNWDYLVETFKEVTGNPAVHKRLTMDEWFAINDTRNQPVANEKQKGDGSVTMRESFDGFFSLYRDDKIQRDWEWIRKVHPGTLSLADWMRKTGYGGKMFEWVACLKNAEQERGIFWINQDLAKAL